MFFMSLKNSPKQTFIDIKISAGWPERNKQKIFVPDAVGGQKIIRSYGNVRHSDNEMIDWTYAP